VCDTRDSTHTLDAAALGDKQARLALGQLCGAPPLRLTHAAHSLQVVHLRGCTGCTFTVPSGVVLAKLFVESCTSCVLHLHGRLLTGHLEVWASDALTLHCSQPLGTLQADGCGSLVVEYARAEHLVAIVHADVGSLQVHIGEHRVRHDVACGAAAVGEGAEPPRADVQFITRWIGTPPQLLTERIIRDATDYPTTARELLEQAAGGGPPGGDGSGSASDPQVVAAAAGAVSDPRVADALQAAMLAKRAALQREEGNTAFRQGDWATAAVKYTSSLAAQPGNAGVLSNRAAAFLKLGKADKAAADAGAALALEPGNVKAAFRHGLALHALGRFSEAGAALSQALAAEPGNAQVRGLWWQSPQSMRASHA
jgi:hypothetical protein